MLDMEKMKLEIAEVVKKYIDVGSIKIVEHRDGEFEILSIEIKIDKSKST